ncbi:MAG: hypothetical protein H5U07_10710 [Candidatus Aminicenantes bacterium]|nr:hypothetical protein [Candidatus Aminicenantes bacterium]
MNNKKVVILLVFLLLLGSLIQASAEVKKIKSLGHYTFARVRGKIPTPEVMKMLAERYAQDIKLGFEQAGMGDIYQPFIEQLKTAQFEDTVWNIGDQVQWMLFRSRGKVKVSGPLEWAGKKPVEVFAVKVKVGFKTYTFIIPKPCGNIAYKGMVEEIPEAICDLKVSPAKANVGDPITVDMSGSQYAKALKVEVFDSKGNKVDSKELSPQNAKWQTKLNASGEYTFKGTAINHADKPSANPCQAKVYINFPPVAKVVPNCLTCTYYYGRPLTFDASGSSDQDGEVTKVTFELRDKDGQVIDSYVDTEKPFVWEKTLYKEGTFTISVTAQDNDGAVSGTSPDSSKSFTVTRKKFFGIAEIVPSIAHGSSHFYIGVRVGIMTWLNPDKFSLTVNSGGLLMTNKSDSWRSSFYASMLGNVHFGKFYFGLGPGFITKQRDDRKDSFLGVGQLGITIFNNYRKMAHMFVEVSSPLNSHFDEYYNIGLGFRYCF